MTGWRTIGVIGGMGPAATADFVQRIAVAAGAARDSDHPRVLVDSNPHVPDRNAARAGNGPSPGPVLAEMARGLTGLGAQILAMPCNAAHGWAGDIVAASGATFVDMIDAAVTEAVATGARTIGIIAIGATLDANLYQHRLDAAGMQVIASDRGIVQPLVTAIKAGDTSSAIRTGMAAEASRLVSAGAGAIIAACTEVPLVLSQADVAVPLVDATSALVRAVMQAAAL
ncbi:aspartate racemase [Polymorphobacter glacialis]|uniref:Aspartate racemase n=1 Tax=Sandarakinorhabdus glacialis TaxID=1614636 RepID=A0A917E7Y0_9SPHN|nr:amino acid racemase [Polymorphobacter glacialis]GGE12914.1 aspartate racemase [Polymorphobacter glacialis]